MRRFILVLLALGVFPLGVSAQQASVGVGATVIRTDFSTSWAALERQSNGSYLLTIHAENSGALASKDTRIELVLSSGWSYDGTSGGSGLVMTQDRPYGEQVSWQLDPIAGNQSVDVVTKVKPTDSTGSSPMFISLSSAYSVPLYLQVKEAGERKTPLWSSWVRSASEYATLTLREFWFRLSTEMRFGLGNR